jgi:hypothetical protein
VLHYSIAHSSSPHRLTKDIVWQFGHTRMKQYNRK